jgi:hypothetical protein
MALLRVLAGRATMDSRGMSIGLPVPATCQEHAGRRCSPYTSHRSHFVGFSSLPQMFTRPRPFAASCRRISGIWCADSSAENRRITAYLLQDILWYRELTGRSELFLLTASPVICEGTD